MQTEVRLRQGILGGSVAARQAKLGSYTRLCHDKAWGREKPPNDQERSVQRWKEEHCSRTVAKRKQDTWTNWDHTTTLSSLGQSF